MKKVYYTDGPDTITAGIAGLFCRGKAKPVSTRLADLLLFRPEFHEATAETPMDDTQDIAALKVAALSADVRDEKEAAEKARAEKAKRKE